MFHVQRDTTQPYQPRANRPPRLVQIVNHACQHRLQQGGIHLLCNTKMLPEVFRRHQLRQRNASCISIVAEQTRDITMQLAPMAHDVRDSSRALVRRASIEHLMQGASFLRSSRIWHPGSQRAPTLSVFLAAMCCDLLLHQVHGFPRQGLHNRIVCRSRSGKVLEDRRSAVEHCLMRIRERRFRRNLSPTRICGN